MTFTVTMPPPARASTDLALRAAPAPPSSPPASAGPASSSGSCSAAWASGRGYSLVGMISLAPNSSFRRASNSSSVRSAGDAPRGELAERRSGRRERRAGERAHGASHELRVALDLLLREAGVRREARTSNRRAARALVGQARRPRNGSPDHPALLADLVDDPQATSGAAGGRGRPRRRPGLGLRLELATARPAGAARPRRVRAARGGRRILRRARAAARARPSAAPGGGELALELLDPEQQRLRSRGPTAAAPPSGARARAGCAARSRPWSRPSPLRAGRSPREHLTLREPRLACDDSRRSCSAVTANVSGTSPSVWTTNRWRRWPARSRMNWVTSRPDAASFSTASSAAFGSCSTSDSAVSRISSASATPSISSTSSSFTSLPP